MTTRRMTKARLEVLLSAIAYLDSVLEDNEDSMLDDDERRVLERRRLDLDIARLILLDRWGSLAR